MSETRHTAATGPTGASAVVPQSRRDSGWVGVVIFAAVMLLTVGAFQAMMGLVALVNPTQYVVTRQGLAVQLDYSVWGWVHVVVGVLAVLAGIGVVGGRLWARVTGIVLAVLAILVNVVFMAAYPVWSVIVIAIDVLVIYALAVHGRELRAVQVY